MAGHHSNWIKVGSGAGQGVSSKGRVYISSAALKRRKLTKSDLDGMAVDQLLEIAKGSRRPKGRALAGGAKPGSADADPVAQIPQGVRAAVEKAAKGKTPGTAAKEFEKAVKKADSAKAAKKPGATKPGSSFGLTDLLKGVGDLSAQGLAQIMANLPPPTRRALVVAAGVATVAAVGAGVAPPVLAVGVLAAAGSIAGGKVLQPGGGQKPKKRSPVKKGGK